MIVLNLPIPPSANNLYPTGKRGRFKSDKYKAWIKEADGWYTTQKRGVRPIAGPCVLSIRVPPGRADVSNLVKPVEDYLVSRGLTGDDKHNRKVSIERDESVTCCVVTITPASDQ